MHILVVDDVAVMREVLSAVAASAFDAAEIRSADNLAEGLVVARGMHRLDIVLLDLDLPDSKGLETLTSFRKAFPKVKVVIVSSTEEDSIIEDALDAGASGFIPKGLRPATMVAALRVIAGGVYHRPGFGQPPGKKV